MLSDKEWFDKNDNDLEKILSPKENDNPPLGINETKFKRTKKTIINVIGCCYDDTTLTGLFRLNTFSNQIEFAKAPPWDLKHEVGSQITDEDLIYFKYYLGKHAKFEPPTGLILEAIIALAKNNQFHPVRNYLNSLVWDNIPRLDDWLFTSAGVARDAYTVSVARKIMVAAVRRVFFPGCEFHSMMILEGGQGIGKSTLVKTLAGSFYANISFGNIDKDTVDAMQGRWIIEVDELVGFNRQDLEKMKSFLTTPVDRARLSYQRTTKPFPRQSIFIGTTNPVGDNTYFRDESGNRRFWPVKCGVMNVAWMRENRDQLFAEAVVAYKGEENVYLDTQEAIDLASMAQEERLAVDPWLEVIAKHLNDPQTAMFTQYVSVLDMAAVLGIDKERLGRVEASRIGMIMKKMGFPSRRQKKDGVKITLYQVGQVDDENIGDNLGDNLGDNPPQGDNPKVKKGTTGTTFDGVF